MKGVVTHAHSNKATNGGAGNTETLFRCNHGHMQWPTCACCTGRRTLVAVEPSLAKPTGVANYRPTIMAEETA
jgi:hypothetical protein